MLNDTLLKKRGVVVWFFINKIVCRISISYINFVRSIFVINSIIREIDLPLVIETVPPSTQNYLLKLGHIV